MVARVSGKRLSILWNNVSRLCYTLEIDGDSAQESHLSNSGTTHRYSETSRFHFRKYRPATDEMRIAGR